VDDVVLVEVVDGLEDLADGLRGILLSELALLADPVEQLATGGQLGDDVVLVLGGRGCQQAVGGVAGAGEMRTLDSNQSTNLTM
jgi:hypothetical protein